MKKILLILSIISLPVSATIISPSQTNTQLLINNNTESSIINQKNEDSDNSDSWNIWRSNIQNQIMKDVNIDYAPLGIICSFSFLVDKNGNISDISVKCPKEYEKYLKSNVEKAIQNLEHKPILNFPADTQRTSTVFQGMFATWKEARYSTPAHFHDCEKGVGKVEKINIDNNTKEFERIYHGY